MPVPELKPLAQAADVLTALGFRGDDVSVLPVSMQVRMPTTLSRVSRRFRKEAQRIFTPGTYTHTLNIRNGFTRLMEIPNAVESVQIHGFDPVMALNQPPPPEFPPMPQWTVEEQWLHWTDWDFWQLSGKNVDVTYSWGTPVPTDVVASVADITARNLTVDPMGALRQSKLLMSRHFRQEVADWVMSGDCGFTKADIAEAQSYRYPLPPAIIATIKQFDMSPSSAFLADTSW
jgi:hypothetical protein